MNPWNVFSCIYRVLKESLEGVILTPQSVELTPGRCYSDPTEC